MLVPTSLIGSDMGRFILLCWAPIDVLLHCKREIDMPPSMQSTDVKSKYLCVKKQMCKDWLFVISTINPCGDFPVRMGLVVCVTL